MFNFIYSIMQTGLWIVLRILALFLPIKRRPSQTIRLTGPYIIIANHKHRLDPLVMVSQLRFSEFWKLIPFRFVTWHTYLRGFGLSLYLCGAFSTHPKKGTALELAQRYINRGQTVVIFPEGQVTKTKGFDDSHMGVGAVYLERENEQLQLLPVKLTYGKQITVDVKKPYRHNKYPKNLRKLMRQTMEELYK